MHKAHALVEIVFTKMSDALCTKYGCDYQLDLDGQVTCTQCGAMDDDMNVNINAENSIIETQVDFE